MPIGAAVGLGLASTAAKVYQGKQANRYNRNALQAEVAHDQQQLEYERQNAQRERELQLQLQQDRIAAEQQARQDAMALERERYNAYVNANQPLWQTGAAAHGRLSEILGLDGGGFSVPGPIPAGAGGGVPFEAAATGAMPPPPQGQAFRPAATSAPAFVQAAEGPQASLNRGSYLSTRPSMMAAPTASGMRVEDILALARSARAR